MNREKGTPQNLDEDSFLKGLDKALRPKPPSRSWLPYREAIALTLEAIAIGLEAIAIRLEDVGGDRF